MKLEIDFCASLLLHFLVPSHGTRGWLRLWPLNSSSYYPSLYLNPYAQAFALTAYIHPWKIIELNGSLALAR